MTSDKDSTPITHSKPTDSITIFAVYGAWAIPTFMAMTVVLFGLEVVGASTATVESWRTLTAFAGALAAIGVATWLAIGAVWTFKRYTHE